MLRNCSRARITNELHRPGRQNTEDCGCVTLCYRRWSWIPGLLPEFVLSLLHRARSIDPLTWSMREKHPSFVKKKITPFVKERHQLIKEKFPVLSWRHSPTSIPVLKVSIGPNVLGVMCPLHWSKVWGSWPQVQVIKSVNSGSKGALRIPEFDHRASCWALQKKKTIKESKIQWWIFFSCVLKGKITVH